jgi:hypothetical protein
MVTSDDITSLETLFKLSLTYPVATVVIMQYKPQAKRSFLNWLIKDFITA